jgi:hypothetical protein
MDQIITRVSEFKPCSTSTVIRYIRAVGIKPIGARQKPQRYPEDSALRILIHLGFRPDPKKAEPQPRVPSMRQLRTERARARRAA